MSEEVNPSGETSIESRIEAALFGSEEAQEPVEDQAQAAEPQVEGADAPSGAEAQPAGDTEVEQEPSFESIYDFAAALEQDPEEFLGSIKAKVKVNGEESEVTLAELQAGYQKDADYRQKTAAFAQERMAQTQQLQQQAQALQDLGNAYENAFMSEYQGVDWSRMQQDDPIEFANRYPAYQARMQQVQQIKQQAQTMGQQAWLQREPFERAKLLNLVPEWTDPAVEQAEKAEIIELLQTEDADPSMVAGVQQSGTAIKLLRELVQLRKIQQQVSAPAEKKIVAKKTSVLRPGARQSQTDKQQDRVNALRSKLKKTGSPKDLNAVLLERM